MNPFAPLGDRDFRLYFTGEVFSTAGSGLHIVAFGWYLLERTGSATSVALVWAIGLGAGIVVLPFAGPLADRYPRRMLAVAADLARLVLVGGMAALAYAGSPSIPVLYVLTFLVGIGHSIFWPSITALLQEVIRPGQLAAASGLVEVTWQAGNLTGAALGGPILVRFGLGTAFAIDAATYAISAIALLALHHRPAPAEGPHESALAMARAGFAYLRRHPALAGFGIASVIPWVATISLNVVIVAYVLQVLHLGATAYGLSDMTYGVGRDGVRRLRRPARPAGGRVAGDDRRDGGADRLLRGARRRPGRGRRLLRAAVPGRVLLVGVSRHHVGLPLQGRAQRGDGAHLVDLPARLDAAPGDRDPVDRARS